MGRVYLRERGIGSCDIDARVLLSRVTGLDHTGILLNGDRVLSGGEREDYSRLLERRAEGEPVAYLVGGKEFMGLDFMVSPAVLIPRPDTELMVEKAIELLKEGKINLLVVDVGTGSGAIAISLAYLVPELLVHCVDISADALEVAAKNAELNGVAQRVKLHQGNLLASLPQELLGKVGLITANLPYIPTEDIHA
ncbi:hypothetical protein N752_30525 [Desulforamulus aquiferis]|nr:HemK/PrmC family methyltransferase [Desulforamulus aquiferis]RYD01332.1 hypothetical protein N752_30525 [Desulforamulus aquiferis]